jgi:hypothetical protein
MNVSKSWSPSIDWSRFAQGTVSHSMWQAFKDLVTLCHRVEYWRDAAYSLRMTTQPDQWQQLITEYENKMHRDAHLANEKVAEMSHLMTQADPDQKLYLAAALSISRSLGHERAHYRSVAFDAFDAAELSDPDPHIIARRWLDKAGLTDQQPQL